ncbi:MAG TPA: hypothetical protein VJM31_17955 [Vicinamibacterales bacterium]|nr:hypothetical protein [Vicinamibacterales bacterium]
MKRTRPSSLARWVLRVLADRNEPLAGDLLEAFQRRQSALWLWGQLLLALLLGSFQSKRAPVALNLTPIDPVVAEWLMSRKLTPRRVNLSSPVEGVGGLGMMLFGLLLSSVVPDVWWFVAGGIASGIVLGTAKVYMRRNHALPDERDGPLVRHYFT